MTKIPPPLLRRAVAAAALLALAACTTVGPDYAGPPSMPAAAQRFARAGDATAPAAADWWTALGDPTLDGLVADAFAASPDVHAAEARLRGARASLDQQVAARRPSSSATAAAVAVRQAPGTDEASSLHLYTAGFDASWELDLFGGTRRAVEAAGAEADAVQADLADAHVSLAAEVVQAYVALRDAQARLALERGLVAIDERRLALERLRVARGADPASALEPLLAQAEASAADARDLEGDIAVSLDELAVLTGRAPGELDGRLAAPSALPALPATLAVGDPAGLLARRPDIRAAERRLASHQAQIGEQVANYFPKVSLFGDLGFSSTSPGHLLRGDSLTLLGVPYLTWNVLDFGRTKAAVRGAEASRDEFAARYESTVLAALRDANTALSRYGTQREDVRRLQAQQASAERSAAFGAQRQAAGADSEFDLLATRRSAAEATARTAAAQASLVKDFAALQKSLGLGWAPPPA